MPPAKSILAIGAPNNPHSADSFLFMSLFLRLAHTKLAHPSQPSRCLQQISKVACLKQGELARALDEQIRARYPENSVAEVEAVVQARTGIWGGMSSGV